jgi:hypothetical protein
MSDNSQFINPIGIYENDNHEAYDAHAVDTVIAPHTFSESSC